VTAQRDELIKLLEEAYDADDGYMLGGDLKTRILNAISE
jgi:hypothetical protein